MSLIIFPQYKVPDTASALDYAGTVLLLHMENLADSGPNALIGTLGGSAAITSGGKFGANALSMTTSSSDGISYPTSQLFNIAANTDFTIEYWLKPSNPTAGGQNATFTFNGASADRSPYVMLSGNNMSWRGINTGNELHPPFAHGMTAGTWYHVAHVKSGTSFSTYINGVRKSTGINTTLVNEAKSFTIGGKGIGTTCAGLIDEFRLSNVARYSGASFDVQTAAFPNKVVYVAQGDPYYNYNSLLLHMDGVDGSTSFVDAIGHPVVSISGSPTIRTNKFKFGGSSTFFNGSGGLVYSNTANTDFAFGAGDFTQEAWIYPTVRAAVSTVISNAASSGNSGLSVYINSTGGLVSSTGSTGLISSADNTIPLNAWTHIAVTRLGTALTLWVNGVSVGTATNSFSFTDGLCSVGSSPFGSAFFTGYIDEVRISKGVARYTSAFALSTVAFPDSVTGAQPNDLYISNVKLLMHMDGANGGTTFTDQIGHTMTKSGACVTSTTKAKYGVSAGYFDGATSSYISTPATADFNFGTGDFTVEAWVNYTALPTQTAAWGGSTYSTWGVVWETGSTNLADGQQLRCNNTQIAYGVDDSTVLSGSHGMTANTWNHIAVSRNAGTIRLFVNGVVVASAAYAGNLPNSLGSTMYLGSETGQGAPHNGYIDEVRVTKGVGRYTATFTPPSEAFPNV